MVTSLAALAAARLSTLGSPLSTRKKLEKSTPPSARPIGGMITSLTRELTIVVKDAPMMTPIARSTTLPRTANFLNSVNTDMGGHPHFSGAVRLTPNAPGWSTVRLRLIALRVRNKLPRNRQITASQRQSQQGAQIIGNEIAPFPVASH